MWSWVIVTWKETDFKINDLTIDTIILQALSFHMSSIYWLSDALHIKHCVFVFEVCTWNGSYDAIFSIPIFTLDFACKGNFLSLIYFGLWLFGDSLRLLNVILFCFSHRPIVIAFSLKISVFTVTLCEVWGSQLALTSQQGETLNLPIIPDGFTVKQIQHSQTLLWELAQRTMKP